MAKRKQHSAQFKTKVALEALKGIEPASVLAARSGVHPTMISRWKNQLLDHAQQAFSTKHDRSQHETEALQAELYEQIGRSTLRAHEGCCLDWCRVDDQVLGSVLEERGQVAKEHQ